MLGIEYGGSATLKTWLTVSVRQDGARLLCEGATKTKKGVRYTFLRNEPTEFSSRNGIYPSEPQLVMQIKTSKKRWVRFGKRTHRKGMLDGKIGRQAAFWAQNVRQYRLIGTLPTGAARLRHGCLLLPQCVSIDVDVVLCGDGPIEVLRHGLLAQLENMLRSVEPGSDGPADAVVQRTAGGFPEFEARAVAGRFVIILHRIVEAARW